MDNLQKENISLLQVVNTLIARHYPQMPLPPEELRLHVGTDTSVGSFFVKGIKSSTRVMETFDPNSPILDWGCGSGRTFRWLLPEWRQVYYGTDVDAAAIRWLSAYANVRTCNDDPPLPYPNETFGGMFAFSVLTHIHPEKHHLWYREIDRVLKPGGTAFLTTRAISTLPSSLQEQHGREYDERGYFYLTQAGQHYKDVAAVSETFTRGVIASLGIPLSIEKYQQNGYANMDTFLLRKG